MATSPIEDLRTRLGASLRIMLSGATEPRALSAAEDGLFGPGSAVWDVHGDASMLPGAIRALLLQSLHPPTMAGVADHSDYKSDPLVRLQRTAGFVSLVTYGSAREIDAAVQHLYAIHEKVTGVAPNGKPYRANDPHLLAWVHATEVDSFLEARRRFGVNDLDKAHADRYVAEMARVGELMGVESPPRSTADLDATLRSYVPELDVNRQTREALRFLAFPPLPLYARGAYGVLFAGAVASLPSWAKRRLWLPPMPITERLAVRPATQLVTRALGWALEPAESTKPTG
jgi:uncharacterized protein (DUF2236 family)